MTTREEELVKLLKDARYFLLSRVFPDYLGDLIDGAGCIGSQSQIKLKECNDLIEEITGAVK